MDTKVNAKTGEWVPSSFGGFLEELGHITASCKQARSLALFRGHREREWLLESTFARSCKRVLFGLSAKEKLSPRVTDSVEFHHVVLNLFLLKFGVLMRPSDELELASTKHGLDAWFEFMKRLQQYPEEDDFYIKGTNLLDWTQSSDVAIYFANESRNGAGAVYMCDATATGKTLQVLAVGEILDKMSELGRASKPLGAPLLFSPPKQIANLRPKNQQAVYFAQMDLRYDLETIWRLHEVELRDEKILIKLVLPIGSKVEVDEYLGEKGISTSFIDPDITTVVEKPKHRPGAP